MTPDIQSEQLILNSARIVFTKKGFAGARMQEIADEAHINRALLHYYFRSKEKLFEKIFTEALEKIFPNINAIINSDDDLFTKIGLIVKSYIRFAMEHPYLPGFVIHELNQHPDKIPGIIKQTKDTPNAAKMMEQIAAEVKAGNIIPVQPIHLIVNIISLCLFPFIAKPMLHAILGLSQEGYDNFISEREQIVTQTIISSIKRN